MHKILFVCTGNICRSPTAEGVLRAYTQFEGLDQFFHFDSAATHGYHIDEPPDPRSIKTALSRGVDISQQRARQLNAKDFQTFDYILALDNSHLQVLRSIAPKVCHAQIALFLEFAGVEEASEVPDPYYGSQKGFEYVLDLVESAAPLLVKKLHPR